MVNNDKTFKQLARRILKWCVARVLQAELDWAWEEANTKDDGRQDDPEGKTDQTENEQQEQNLEKESQEMIEDPIDPELSDKLGMNDSPSVKKQSLGQWSGSIKNRARRVNTKGRAHRRQPLGKLENIMMVLMEQGIRLQQNYTHLQMRVEKYGGENNLVTP